MSAGPKTFYVSKAAANATTHDGSSWTTAWPELDQIDWSKVKPGDTVKLGNGSYRKTLTVGANGTAAKPITLLTEADPNSRLDRQSLDWVPV